MTASNDLLFHRRKEAALMAAMATVFTHRCHRNMVIIVIMCRMYIDDCLYLSAISKSVKDIFFLALANVIHYKPIGLGFYVYMCILI